MKSRYAFHTLTAWVASTTLVMGQGFEDIGFSISVDDVPVAGAPAPKRNATFAADVALDIANLDVRYDGLTITPRLNILTDDLRTNFAAGELVRFRATTNYPTFIFHAEVRVSDASERLIAQLPIDANGAADWPMRNVGYAGHSYVLRVYDDQGRYNETAPRLLVRGNVGVVESGPVMRAGAGDDHTHRTGFRPRGGTVTVSGSGLSPAGSIALFREVIPIDPQGNFVVERILPAGSHGVEIQLPTGAVIGREVIIPRQDFLTIGLIDLTFGRRLRDDAAAIDGMFERNYADGRLAFFIDGQSINGMHITAAADTGYGPLQDAFRRLDDRAPRAILDRFNADNTYPVYGDDSTRTALAPTSGRVFVRVEKDRSAAQWGDFDTNIQAGQYLSNSRALYGAQLSYGSVASQTESGQSIVSATLYAAQPDMLPQRDSFRGTGGSAYFLSRRDIHAGTAVLAVEVRDPETGRLLRRDALQEGTDYSIDHLKGFVLLVHPLSGTDEGNDLVARAGSQPVVNLVAQYEYTPELGDVSGASVGGRFVYRPNDALTIGLTGMREETGIADQEMLGADLSWRFGVGSWLEAETARTEGPGFGQVGSLDGGFTLQTDDTTGLAQVAAKAVRFAGHFEMTDFGLARDGNVGFYLERKDSGFSTFSENVANDQELAGVYSTFAISDYARISADLEHFRTQGVETRLTANAAMEYQITSQLSVATGIAYLDQSRVGNTFETGTRTDLAVRLSYAFSDDTNVYVFAQGTAARSGGLADNTRYGIGGAARVAEWLRVEGEVSDGTNGSEGRLRFVHTSLNGNETYIGYTRKAKSGAERWENSAVVGGRRQYNAAFSAFAERTATWTPETASNVHAFGVTYTPNDLWSFESSFETGSVREAADTTFERNAIGFNIIRSEGDHSAARIKIEYQIDNGTGSTRDRESWLVSGHYSYKTSDDWQLVTDFDAYVATSSDPAVGKQKYAEATVGFAYRPIDNDRTNAFLGLTALHDLPSVDQRDRQGDSNSLQQRSIIFSFDVTHQLNETWTVGGKYGYRMGSTAPRDSDDFEASSAHLLAVRADWHVIDNWDLTVEARALHSPEAEATDVGYSAAVYRHVGNNLRVGIGYEFGDVSDDLRDVSYQSEGVFINIVAKF